MKTEVDIMRIVCIRGEVTDEEAGRIIAPLAPGFRTVIRKLVFYPYFRLRSSIHVKTILRSRLVTVSCLVDLCSGQVRTTDQFDTEEREAERDSVLSAKIPADDALKKAREYAIHSTVHRMRTLSYPEIEVREKGIVYKPFWIAECSRGETASFRVIVDSVTGRFEPL